MHMNEARWVLIPCFSIYWQEISKSFNEKRVVLWDQFRFNSCAANVRLASPLRLLVTNSEDTERAMLPERFGT